MTALPAAALAVAAPLLGAAVVLLVSLPRRRANWRLRQDELTLELDHLERQRERDHAEIAKARVERLRQLKEQLAVRGQSTPGARAAAHAKIEPTFRHRHEEVELKCDVEVSRRRRLLDAGTFTQLFADDCQRR